MYIRIYICIHIYINYPLHNLAFAPAASSRSICMHRLTHKYTCVYTSRIFMVYRHIYMYRHITYIDIYTNTQTHIYAHAQYVRRYYAHPYTHAQTYTFRCIKQKKIRCIKKHPYTHRFLYIFIHKCVCVCVIFTCTLT